jgi:hypothetical protein
MQHDIPFESPSSLSTPPERDDTKHPFDHDLMNVNSYLPPFIQPEHQPAGSEMNLLHSPLPSPPNMNTVPPDPYFQKPSEGNSCPHRVHNLSRFRIVVSIAYSSFVPLSSHSPHKIHVLTEVSYGRTQRDSTLISPSPSPNTPSPVNGVGGSVAGGSGTSLSGTSNGADKVVMVCVLCSILPSSDGIFYSPSLLLIFFCFSFQVQQTLNVDLLKVLSCWFRLCYKLIRFS